MGMLSEVTTRFRALIGRQALERDLEDELRSHIDMETEELIAQGHEPKEARRIASMSFGTMPTVVEECREQRGVGLLEDTTRDLKHGIRQLIRAPRFSLAALASLSLGIGATVIVYSVLQAVLLNSLPYSEPERLVRFYELTPEGDRFSTSDLNAIDFENRSQGIESIAVEVFPAPSLLLEPEGNSAGEPRAVQGLRVSGNFFSVFGIVPTRGRFWTPEDTAPGTEPKQVVVSERMWRSLFDDAALVDQTARLGGENWQIIGVAPNSFRYGALTDIWLPYTFDLDRNRGDHRLDAIARIAPGFDLPQAEEELRSIAANLGAEYPESNGQWSVELQPLRDYLIGEEATATTIALLVAVGLLLLLACSSVSGLMMARSTSRSGEFSLRRALGASRGRLARQLLTESLLLCTVGTGLGLFLAVVALPLVKSRASGALPRLDQVTLSPLALIVTCAIALLTSLMVGVAPALRATSRGAAGSRGHRSQRLRSLLVAAQIAVALVLSMGSLSLLQSFDRLSAVPTGFDAKGLVTVDIVLPPDRYPEGSEAVLQFYRRSLEELATVPGITHTSASTLHPFVGPALANTVGLPSMVDRREFTPVAWRAVLPGTFRTMGISLLRGRDFAERETSRVAILSESLATRLYGERDPIGQEVRWISPQGPVATVIGVVSDVRDLQLTEEPIPTYYWFQDHMRWTDMTLLLRAEREPHLLTSDVRTALRRVDATLPPPQVGSALDDQRDAVAAPRLNLQVISLFAVIAVVIALVGLYGLVSYSVASRRSEIALRLALGAKPSGVGTLFLGQGMKLLATGVLVGLLGLFFVASLMNRLLYQTDPFEPGLLIAVIFAFAAATAFASLAPALRETKQNPRSELM